jgi:hypothetical protein
MGRGSGPRPFQRGSGRDEQIGRHVPAGPRGHRRHRHRHGCLAPTPTPPCILPASHLALQRTLGHMQCHPHSPSHLCFTLLCSVLVHSSIHVHMCPSYLIRRARNGHHESRPQSTLQRAVPGAEMPARCATVQCAFTASPIRAYVRAGVARPSFSLSTSRRFSTPRP